MIFRTLLCVFTFIFHAISCYSQSYRSVLPDRTSFFVNAANEVKALRIDSLFGNIDTVYFPMNNIRENGFGCYTSGGASWLGKKVLIRTNGDNVFYNRDGDAILLKTTTALNEVWKCFERSGIIKIYARTTAISYENVLGAADSVRNISFEAHDGNDLPVSHEVNGLMVRLSRSWGIIRALNFYFFPDIETTALLNETLAEYDLSGYSNPPSGQQNLLWMQCFDFEAGDELHTTLEETVLLPPPQPYQKSVQTITKILYKTVFSDSVQYESERKIKTIYSNQSGTTENYQWDTNVFTIRKDTLFDKLPGEVITVNNTTYAMTMDAGSIISKTLPSVYETFINNGNDTCLFETIADGCFPAYTYYKGLGGPYYSCTYNGKEERKLVYYKKGTETWGTPLVIDVGLSYEQKKDAGFTIYPNPAGSVFHVQTEYNSKPYSFIIYDVLGKEVLRLDGIKGNCSITRPDKAQGLFFYQIIADGNRKLDGKLLFTK